MSTPAEHLNHACGIDPYCDDCNQVGILRGIRYCQVWDVPLQQNGTFLVRAWPCQREGTKHKTSND